MPTYTKTPRPSETTTYSKVARPSSLAGIPINNLEGTVDNLTGTIDELIGGIYTKTDKPQ